MGAALTVIPWTKAVRRLNVLVEFSIFWKARLFLVLIGSFWLVCLLKILFSTCIMQHPDMGACIFRHKA